MSNLLNDNKELMREYNYEKNNNVELDILTSGSHKKIWWICSNGHEWEAEIKSRSLGRGCPYCANKKLLKGYNDLETTNPELAKEWNYEKNSDLRPSDFIAGSHKKVWWKCSKGHEWESYILGRKDRGCPYCANRIVLKGYNDLETTNPQLAEEWNYKKNKLLLPSDVMAGTEKKVWWICSNGHEWEASIKNRNIGQQCPFCTNTTLLKGYNDLETTNPELAKEWNYEKNKGLKPSDIIAGSNKVIWWKCSKGHEWKTKSLYRNYGQNCPYCANKKLLKGYNDLETTNPKLAKEWNYKKNGNLRPSDFIAGTHKKIWWKCSKGHEWEAPIKSRNAGIGCPQCSDELRTSMPERTIFYYINQYFSDAINNYHSSVIANKELDIFIPSINVGIEYDGQYYHKDYKKDKLKDDLCKKNNIRLYRIREKDCKQYQSSSIKIYLDENNKSSLEKAISLLLKDLLNKSITICIDKDINKIYDLINFMEKEVSLMNINPELAKEWNYEKNGDLLPSQVSAGSHKKVWWKCPKGHEWISEIKSRNSGRNCPYCSNNKVLEGYNDLATINPNLAKEWNYEKNGDLLPNQVLPGSEKKVWWKCSNGHEWQAIIKSRSGNKNRKGTGCPNCAK